MLRRLTRRVRVTAGWLIALAYLFCVVAPGAALALGRGPVPCFAEDFSAAVVAEAHDSGAMTHMHPDGPGHDHMAMHTHHHGGSDDQPAHRHDGKSLPGPCCAMLCVVAIPADLPAVGEPAQPTASRIAEADFSVPGRTPPLLYRPPIA
jgi:hypothetical protein